MCYRISEELGTQSRLIVRIFFQSGNTESQQGVVTTNLRIKTGSSIRRSEMKSLAAILRGFIQCIECPPGCAFFFDDCWNAMNDNHETFIKGSFKQQILFLFSKRYSKVFVSLLNQLGRTYRKENPSERSLAAMTLQNPFTFSSFMTSCKFY